VISDSITASCSSQEWGAAAVAGSLPHSWSPLISLASVLLPVVEGLYVANALGGPSPLIDGDFLGTNSIRGLEIAQEKHMVLFIILQAPI